MSNLKIEAGKRYWRRDGMLSGTIAEIETHSKFKFKDLATGHYYTKTGSFSGAGQAYFDLEKPEHQDEIISISGDEYQSMKRTINEQNAEINRLKRKIERKNAVMSEIIEMCEKEVEPKAEKGHKKSPLLKAVSEAVMDRNRQMIG